MPRPAVRVKPRMAIYYALEMLLFAFLFFGVTLWIYAGLAEGDLLRTYLWNIALIALVLLIEQLLDATVYSRRAVERAGRSWWGKAWIVYMLVTGFGSVKPALYLFYLVALVISRISALAPGTLDDYFTAYFTTIEGSLILLVVFDKLIELVVKDYRITARLTSTAARALRGRSAQTDPEPGGPIDRPAS